MLALPMVIAIIAGAILGVISLTKTIGEQEKTVIDMMVDTVQLKDAWGNIKTEYSNPLTGTFMDVQTIQNIVVKGNKTQVHILKRETPRNYWRFYSSAEEVTLVIPEEK